MALKPRGLRGRLLLIFFVISLAPLFIVGATFLYFLVSNVESETFARLGFVTEAKRSEIRQYLTFAGRQAGNLSQTSTVRYSIGEFYGFSYGFRQIEAEPDAAEAILRQGYGADDAEASQADRDALLRQAVVYANMHGQFHDDYSAFVESSEFDNLYLIGSSGRVVYSVGKDAYFARSLTGDLAGSPLGRIEAALKDAPQDTGVYFRDFERDPVTGAFAAYVAIRVQYYRRAGGVIVFRLPPGGLNALSQSEAGSTGQIYLMSSAGLIVAAPEGSGLTPGDASPHAGPDDLRPGMSRPEKGMGGEAALMATAGIDAWGVPWLLASEVPAAIAYASSMALFVTVLTLAVVSVPLLLLLAATLARSTTAPVVRLTDAAEAIADGDLDRSMPDIQGPIELKRLAGSFRRMRDAVRDQLALISRNSAELEKNVKAIAEKNQQLEEADRLKDTFLANTSHELRTPLNGIVGIAETLSAGAAGELSQAQRSQLQLITFSARRLSRLVDDLLDLYRIRQGRLRLDMQAVHVATSLRNVLQLAEPLLRGEPITLRVDIPQDIPLVLADPVRFEQILYNLVGNAIKYTEQGSIQIYAERHDNQVDIVISDTGPGIAPDALERMFQPLEQGDNIDSSGKSGSSGLGLTIARQLTTALDGRLSARSALGEGSRFTLTLPVAETGADGMIKTHRRMEVTDEGYHETLNTLEVDTRPAIAVDDDSAPVILVVDDEPINIQVLRNVLIPQGYTVHVAENGGAALDAVDKHAPDLIILDVMMPDMSGLDVARRLRQRHDRLSLPIVMVTARSRTRDVIAGLEAGANDYVVKPFIKDELLARISTLLEAARGRRQAIENTELQEEIDRRIQIEDALRLSQRRMASLLDTLAVGLVCVQPSGRVSYANKQAETVLGQPVETGQAIASLLPGDLFKRMLAACEADGDYHGERLSLGEGRPEVSLSAFELEPEAGGGIAVIIAGADLEATGQGERLVQSVRGALDSVGPLSDPETEGAETPLDDMPSGDDREAYRQTVVDVVNLSLDIWRQAKGKNKFDLAERSGVWRVSLDRSSLQTRTLDKYMLVDTLPANPRWRDVIRTGEFVLAETGEDDGDAGDRDELADKLARLREMVRDGVAKWLETGTA